MGSLLLKGLVAYLEAHPEQVVDLIAEGATAAINALKKHNAAQAKA